MASPAAPGFQYLPSLDPGGESLHEVAQPWYLLEILCPYSTLKSKLFRTRRGFLRADLPTCCLSLHPSKPPDTGEAAGPTDPKSRTLVSLSGSSKAREPGT